MAQTKKQYIIFGIGRFGSALAKTLIELGHEVLAVDSNEEHIHSITPYVTQAIQVNATDEEAMHSLGIRNFDAAIVSIGDNLRDSILVTMVCKELGAKYVVAKASDEMHAKLLKKIGADRVIFPERDMGIRAAKTISSPNVLELMNLTGDYTLEDITVPASWVGSSLQELDIRRKYSVSVLLIHRGSEVLVNVPGNARLQKNDALLVLGHKDDVQRLEELD